MNLNCDRKFIEPGTTRAASLPHFLPLSPRARATTGFLGVHAGLHCLHTLLSPFHSFLRMVWVLDIYSICSQTSQINVASGRSHQSITIQHQREAKWMNGHPNKMKCGNIYDIKVFFFCVTLSSFLSNCSKKSHVLNAMKFQF